MIGFTGKGDLKRTTSFLTKMLRRDHYSDLERYGRMGVEAMARATPVDQGLTASSWTYSVIRGSKPGIVWRNTNSADGTPVAILIQYGHGTGTGGYVQGRNFINPAMHSVFEKIADDIWRKVVRS